MVEMTNLGWVVYGQYIDQPKFVILTTLFLSVQREGTRVGESMLKRTRSEFVRDSMIRLPLARNSSEFEIFLSVEIYDKKLSRNVEILQCRKGYT